MYYQKKSGNKYGAKSSEFQGIYYDSKLEASVAEELELRRLAKDIKKWDRQITLKLEVNGYHICDYRIDFIAYNNDNSREFIEVKGMELPLWRLKWKLFEALFDKNFKKHSLDKMTVIKQQSNYQYLKQKYGKK